MFINNGDTGNNRFSAYVLTICIVLLTYILFSIIPMRIDLEIGSTDLSAFQNGDMSGLVAYFGRNKFLFYILLPFSAVFFALLLCVKYLHKRKPLSVITGRASFDFKRFFFSFILWGTILGISLFLAISQNDQIKWNFNPQSFIILCLISIVFITLQTACEEILFRGYLFQALVQRTGNKWIGVVLTSLLFGLMHGANPEVEALGYSVLLYYVLTGFFLGVIAMKDNGLELSMGYHAINNIFASVFLTNNWQAFQTDALYKDYSQPTFGLDSILTLVILQPILLFIFSKVYKW